MSFFRPIALVRLPVFLLLTACLIWIEWTIVHTSVFSQHPISLTGAVLFDLVFVTTAFFYGLVTRPLHWPNSRLWLVALLMLRVALFILPETSLHFNQRWPVLLIFIEGMVLVIAGLRIRAIRRAYKQFRAVVDAETALQQSLATVFGERVASIVIGELLTIYYALLGWQLRPTTPVGTTALTTHRESGQIALTVSLLVVGLLEGVVVHLLLNRWSPNLAIWITAFSAYGMLFFIADIVATVKRPSYVATDQLHVRLGIRWQAIVPRSAIIQVTRIQEKPAKESGQLNGAFLTAPNVLLTFNQPIKFSGPYGLQKSVLKLSLFVDSPTLFAQALKVS